MVLVAYVAMLSMLEAAHQRDAECFNRYVDYPRVRGNLNDQFGARVGEADERRRDVDWRFGRSGFATWKLTEIRLP